jgi:hypothetical protein
MTISIQELKIIMMENALRNTIEYENRCRRRMQDAQDILQTAMATTIRHANELEEAKRTWIRGGK